MAMSFLFLLQEVVSTPSSSLVVAEILLLLWRGRVEDDLRGPQSHELSTVVPLHEDGALLVVLHAGHGRGVDGATGLAVVILVVLGVAGGLVKVVRGARRIP